MTIYYIRRCPFTKNTSGCVRVEAMAEIAAAAHGWQTCSCWRYWLYRLTGI